MSTIETLPQSLDRADDSSTEDVGTGPGIVTVTTETAGPAVEHHPDCHQFRPFPHLLKHPFQAAYWTWELGFGLFSLFALLAFLAAIPLVNFLALGYLLEAEGRVARTGKLRYALPLLPLAPKIGGIAVGTWFWWWVVRLVADAASDATLLAPETGLAAVWQLGVIVVSLVVATHLTLAIARGGRLGLFFWPTPLNALWLWKEWKHGNYLVTAGDAVNKFVSALRLRHHFWLGVRGFTLAFVWLFIPTVLFASLKDTSKPIQVILTLLGGAALTIVLTWVPFLQARFAAENRWRAMFELQAIRELYRRAPLAMSLSVVVLYALSLPLYLFKVAALPTDVYWLLTPIFIASIYPAKILIGWAYAQATQSHHRAWLLLRWPLNIVLLPLLGIYVFALFFTPAIGAAGRAVLFQHHGILLPWPF